MPGLFHKSSEYGNKKKSLTRYAQRAFGDKNGNDIDTTYVKSSAINSIIENYVTGSDGIIRELTQIEYDLLSNAEKNNGTIYLITDSNDGYLLSVEDVMVSLTESQYNILSTAEKNNGKIYFITNSSWKTAPEIINTMNNKGEIVSSNLPDSGTATGDYYYLTDKLEGRYWNGTSWLVVL